MATKKPTLKCKYTFCKHKEEEVEKIDGWHSDCLKEKDNKKKILDLYVKYYKSEEKYATIQRAIKDMCHNHDSELVLYYLCHSIKEKIPYKSIFTLGWLLNNEQQIKKKYEEAKLRIEVKKINFEDVQSKKQVFMEYKKVKKKTIDEQLFG